MHFLISLTDDLRSISSPQDCILVQTYSNNGDGTYNFEVQSMEADVDGGSGWVAVGWGKDDVMGDDTVVMCNDFVSLFRLGPLLTMDSIIILLYLD